MDYALIDPATRAFVRMVGNTGVQWNGFTFGNLDLVDRATRVANFIYDWGGEVNLPVYPQVIESSKYVVGNGVVTLKHALTNLPAERVIQDHNKTIDSKLLRLEQDAIEQGLLRLVIEDLHDRTVALAKERGVDEDQLLDPKSPDYSRSFEKLTANMKARETLRATRL